MPEVLLRPLTTADLRAAERLSAEAFLESDRLTGWRSWPEPELRPAARSEKWIARTARTVASDPEGCWAADLDGELVGFAASMVRDSTWILATYAVRPRLHGRGLGRQLLEAAMASARHCTRGMLSASAHPAAVRRYLGAGFTLHPQMFLRGTVDRAAIPVIEKVREATLADVDLMDSLDRRTRGAAHGHDHEHFFAECRVLVSDSTTGSGYVVLERGEPVLLAATNRRTASRLLWAAIADGPAEFTISHVTAANAWAVEVGSAARLDLFTGGYLALRGMEPPTPYVHHGALL